MNRGDKDRPQTSNPFPTITNPSAPGVGITTHNLQAEGCNFITPPTLNQRVPGIAVVEQSDFCKHIVRQFVQLFASGDWHEDLRRACNEQPTAINASLTTQYFALPTSPFLSPSPYRSRLGIENKKRHHAERADDAHRRRGPRRADRRRQGADERADKKQ